MPGDLNVCMHTNAGCSIQYTARLASQNCILVPIRDNIPVINLSYHQYHNNICHACFMLPTTDSHACSGLPNCLHFRFLLPSTTASTVPTMTTPTAATPAMAAPCCRLPPSPFNTAWTTHSSGATSAHELATHQVTVPVHIGGHSWTHPRQGPWQVLGNT